MNTQDILDYLTENPDFLVEHATSLGIYLRDDKVRSFAQAKLAAADVKMANMRDQLSEVIQAAEDNALTMERMNSLYTALLGANTVGQLVDAVENTLAKHFNLPCNRLVIWAEPKNRTRIPKSVRIDNKQAIDALLMIEAPQLGSAIAPSVLNLLPNKNTILESFLHLPVWIEGDTGAMLLAGDENAERFQADLPTEWLENISNAISVALCRIMGYR